MARIRRGDTVVVLRGKDRGKTGKVLRVFPTKTRALVESINMMKHFDRRTQENQQGGVVERESPIALAKLTLVDPTSKKPCRVGWTVAQDGTKSRISRQSGEPI